MSMARAKFMLCLVAVTLWIPLSFASTTTNQNKDQGPYINITDTQVLKLTCKLLEKVPIDKLEVTYRPFNDHNNDTIASIISSNKDIIKSELYSWVEVKGQVNKSNPENSYLQLTFPRNDTFTGNFACRVTYGIYGDLQNIEEISVGKDFKEKTEGIFQGVSLPVHMATIRWIPLKSDLKEIRVYRCAINQTGNSFKDISLFIKNDIDNPYKSSLVILIFNKTQSNSEKSEYEWNLYIQKDAYDTRNYNYSAEITTQRTPCFEQEHVSSQRNDNSIIIGLSVGMLLTFVFGMGAGALLMYCLKFRSQTGLQNGRQNGRQTETGAMAQEEVKLLNRNEREGCTENNAADNHHRPERSADDIDVNDGEAEVTGTDLNRALQQDSQYPTGGAIRLPINVTETPQLITEGPREDSRDEEAHPSEQIVGDHQLETPLHNQTSSGY